MGKVITKLTDAHKGELLTLVEKEKELNLFIIGDIENYGFDKEFIEVWGEFDENGHMKAVLLSFYKNFIIYSREDFDVLGFVEIMKKNDFKMLSGERSIVERFSKHLDIKGKREMYFAKLDNPRSLYEGELSKKVLKTEQEDIKKLWDLHVKMNGGRNTQSLEMMEKKYRDRAGRGYHIKNDKYEIVSSAETGAENASSAMVMAVATDNNFRGHGYATAVVSQLCRVLLDEGKSLCLFYDNPKAGKIYGRLGFENIGMWSMWTRED